MDTKDLILENTLKLMIKKRNSIVSIREISDANGIAIGGIYYYFSNKKEIYDEIIKKYAVEYIKFDINKLSQIKGNAKEKIHNAFVEIFKQKQTGIKINKIEEEIDYRLIMTVLTPNVFSYEKSYELYQIAVEELKDYFEEIVEEGKKTEKYGKTYQPKTLQSY